MLVGSHTACADDHRAELRPGRASAAIEPETVGAPVGAGSSFGLAAREDQTCAWFRSLGSGALSSAPNSTLSVYSALWSQARQVSLWIVGAAINVARSLYDR